MNEERRKLRARRSAIDSKAESLKKSIAAFSAELRSCGASEDEIFASLRNEREMLARIYAEDYPNIEAAEKRWLRIERLQSFTFFAYDYKIESVDSGYIDFETSRLNSKRINTRNNLFWEYPSNQLAELSIPENQHDIFAEELCAA